jgi:hypothetical protein
MTKILSPNPQLNSIRASVQFHNGVGETDDPRLIDWFREHGYVIDEETPQTITEAQPVEPQPEPEPVSKPEPVKHIRKKK